MKFSWYLSGLAVLACTGCSQEFIGRPDLRTVENAALPAPDTLATSVGTRASVLGPGDQISVDVFGVAELSREVTVQSGGSIALPLVGTLQAAGRTTDELGEEIRSRLVGRYVRDPSVSVNLVEVASQIFAIEGEVRAPGVYPLVGQTTLMRAVARGGGTTEFADDNFVVLYRRVADENMAALYDLRAIRLGAYEDPSIYPGDMLVVGEDRAIRLFGQVVQSTGILLAPIVTLIR